MVNSSALSNFISILFPQVLGVPTLPLKNYFSIFLMTAFGKNKWRSWLQNRENLISVRVATKYKIRC